MLEKVNSIKDLKKLGLNDLPLLCDDIRKVILSDVLASKGHLGSNLGVIEITTALHYVFNSPIDKIVFDVSHQCYTHKILTGRKQYFIDGNALDKIGGFTTPCESEHDLFKVGHTSTSIGLALGLAKARDLNRTHENIIALIGDGSLSGGVALEALNMAGEYSGNLIIIVNDNDMSIAENHGGIYKNLKQLRDNKGVFEYNLFKSFGLDYYYYENGNDVIGLVDLFNKFKNINHPIILHIKTQKGKGFEAAEIEKEKYHFYVNGGRNVGSNSPIAFTKEFIKEEISKGRKLVCINAATPNVFGFNKEYRESLKEHYIDVGIAEQNAVTMTAGMAKNLVKPVYFVNCPFLGRAYDQLNHDLGMNSSNATVMVYNTAFAGGDCTHKGIFDIGLVSNIPNFENIAPATESDYKKVLEYAFADQNHPIVVRVPVSFVNLDKTCKGIEPYLIYEGSDVAIIGLGHSLELANEVYKNLTYKGISCSLINPLIYSKIDEDFYGKLINHKVIVTIEEGVIDNGFGEKVDRFFAKYGVKCLNFGSNKDYNDLRNINDIYKDNHYTVDLICEDVLKVI